MDRDVAARLESIVALAQERGLVIARESIQPLETHGFMSQVMTADTDRGPVVINIVAEPIPEQLYQQVPEKIAKASELLQHLPQVPRVYVTGNLPAGGYFIVQERKSGNPFGKRSYQDGHFVDEFLVSAPERYLTELERVVGEMHSVHSDNFGYLLGDCYATWPDFLSATLERNLETLEKSQAERGIHYFMDHSRPEIREHLLGILHSHPELFSVERASLIHGDIFNFSNVLVSETKVEAVIDFEWTLFGHPAWEFVFIGHPPLETYLPLAVARGLVPAGLDFRRSIELHTPFWLLWGAATHATHPTFGQALFSAYIEWFRQHRY